MALLKTVVMQQSVHGVVCLIVVVMKSQLSTLEYINAAGMPIVLRVWAGSHKITEKATILSHFSALCSCDTRILLMRFFCCEIWADFKQCSL